MDNIPNANLELPYDAIAKLWMITENTFNKKTILEAIELNAFLSNNNR